MTTVTVSNEGHILIPETVRERCHITPGMELEIAVVNGEIHLKPTLAPISPTTVSAGRGLLANQNRKRLSETELKSRIARALHRRDAATKPLQ